MPWRPRYPCTRCGRLTGCACARTSPRNHGGVSAAQRGYGAAHQAERAALAEDEVYVADLIGCSLVDVAGVEPLVVGESAVVSARMDSAMETEDAPATLEAPAGTTAVISVSFQVSTCAAKVPIQSTPCVVPNPIP